MSLHPFRHCVRCGGLIWPWQEVNWYVLKSGKTRYWHGKHWTRG